jgi:hypothetical protein
LCRQVRSTPKAKKKHQAEKDRKDAAEKKLVRKHEVFSWVGWLGYHYKVKTPRSDDSAARRSDDSAKKIRRHGKIRQPDTAR